MSAVIFLLGAVVVAAVGIAILIYVTREPSKSSLSSIDDFTRRKQALAPRDATHGDGGIGPTDRAMTSRTGNKGRGV